MLTHMAVKKIRPSVLAVGAFQMDNFGDLLFQVITDRYLPDADVVPGSPFVEEYAFDTAHLLGRGVQAYGPLLENRRFDVIWTVGGEIGGNPEMRGLDLAYFFEMSAHPEVYRSYARKSPADRERILRRATGYAPIEHPYLPSCLEYPKNSGTVSVLNSVGMTHILNAPPSARRKLVSLLRGTTFVSVRDKESSELLRGLGIDHVLVPDIVHTISTIMPPRAGCESGAVLVHLPNHRIDHMGKERVGKAIAHAPSLRGRQVKLVLTGTGTHMNLDSVADKKEFAEYLRSLRPDIDIGVLESRQPLDIVDEIRNARAVVGASLHLRIVASAYNVPRVNFADSHAKVERYARQWDPDMPYNVTPETLDDAIVRAVAQSKTAGGAKRSEELTRLADENLDRIVREIIPSAAAESETDRLRRTELRQGFADIAAAEATGVA
jgi:hypothetical protein